MQFVIILVAFFAFLTGLNFSCDQKLNSTQDENISPIFQKSLNFATENVGKTKVAQEKVNEQSQPQNNSDEIGTINNACRTQIYYHTCENTCSSYPTCSNTCSGTQPTCLGYETCNGIRTTCTYTCTFVCGIGGK